MGQSYKHSNRLHVQHLLVHLLRAHAAAEETARREVAPVTRIGRAHLRCLFRLHFRSVSKLDCVFYHTDGTMFFASNICCVSSGTVSARYCCDPRDVRGAKPSMKKCLHCSRYWDPPTASRQTHGPICVLKFSLKTPGARSYFLHMPKCTFRDLRAIQQILNDVSLRITDTNANLNVDSRNLGTCAFTQKRFSE